MISGNFGEIGELFFEVDLVAIDGERLNNLTKIIKMTQKTHRQVPLGSRIFPDRSPLSEAEIAKHQAENREFSQRCRAIFHEVYPELVAQHYNWFIHIEPDSEDYFIDPDEEVSFQKARSKHPTARIMAMRLNETGTCGRI